MNYNSKIRVACLPVACDENPYQHLMMNGLREDLNLAVDSGFNDRFFGIIRTAVFQRPHYIHFDWETSYYYRKYLILTLVFLPSFIIQVLFVKYVMRCKMVWTPHNLVPHDVKHFWIHKFCRIFFASQMDWIRLFDESSVERASSVFRISHRKFKIVPEGSYVGYYPNNFDKETSRNLLEISLDRKVLLYFGLIKPYKGVLELVKAFNKLMNKEDLLLLIVGKAMDNEYFSEIKKNINSSILIREGFVDDNDLQVYFNASDIVVLPFENIENSGSVILAMGFEKPVLTRDLGVVSVRLKDQKGLLYASNRITSEALNSVLKLSKSDLEEIGNRNKKNVLKYTWSDYAMCFYPQN